MPPVLARLFLLTLLLGDWAWDTHFGNDCLNQPMSFSQATLAAAGDDLPARSRVHGPWTFPQLALLAAPAEPLVPQATPERPDGPRQFQDRARIYVFMSLRC